MVDDSPNAVGRNSLKKSKPIGSMGYDYLLQELLYLICHTAASIYLDPR